MTTPDGCPVDAYAALPAEPELSAVRSFIQTRRHVLDLGAGTGRIANPLGLAGYVVVAVDESAEMLAHVTHATAICARIEEFDADQRSDAVLLLSHLINTPATSLRRSLLATVARHLAPGGLAVIQRHDPSRRFRPGQATIGEVGVALVDLDDADWPTVRAITRYQLGDQSWDQPWEALVLDDAATIEALDASGMSALRIDGPWVLAELARDA